MSHTPARRTNRSATPWAPIISRRSLPYNIDLGLIATTFQNARRAIEQAIINPPVIVLQLQTISSTGSVTSTNQIMRIESEAKEAESKDDMEDISSDSDSENLDSSSEEDTGRKRQRVTGGMRVTAQASPISVPKLIRQIKQCFIDKTLLSDVSNITNTLLVRLLKIGNVAMVELHAVLPDEKWNNLQLHIMNLVIINSTNDTIHPMPNTIVQLITYYRSLPITVASNSVLRVISQYVQKYLHRVISEIDTIEQNIAIFYVDIYMANLCESDVLIQTPGYHPTAFTRVRDELINEGSVTQLAHFPLKLRAVDPELYDAIILHSQDKLVNIEPVAVDDLLAKLKIATLERLITNIDSTTFHQPSMLLQVAIDRQISANILQGLLEKYSKSRSYPRMLLLSLSASIVEESYVIAQITNMKNPIIESEIVDPICRFLCASVPASRDLLRAFIVTIGSVPIDIIEHIHRVHSGFLDEPDISPLLSFNGLVQYGNVSTQYAFWQAHAWEIFIRYNERNFNMRLDIISQTLVDSWTGSDMQKMAMRDNMCYLTAIFGTDVKLNNIYHQLDSVFQTSIMINSIELLVRFSTNPLQNAKIAMFIREHVHDNPLPVETILKLRTQANPIFELSDDESLRLLIACKDDIIPTARSSAVIYKLKNWEQAILAEKCSSVGFKPHLSNRRYRLEWISDPTWPQFRRILFRLKNDPMIIENGNGTDAGAPRREFYSRLSPKLHHLFVTVDGYLMPRNDLENIDIHALKILLQRLVYIDYVLLQTTTGSSKIESVRPELDLHPALLILMTLPDITDGKTQWNQITHYFGSWLSDIVPRSSFERKLSSIYSELSEKYQPYYETILKIAEEFTLYPLTPRELQNRLVGKVASIDTLIDKVEIVERPNSESYLMAFKDVLHQFPQNLIPQLMLFWFGTERPDFNTTTPLLQLVTCDAPNNLSITRNIISHACIGQLDIPRLVNLPEISQHTFIVEDINRLLRAALENQQRAESINWLYQQS